MRQFLISQILLKFVRRPFSLYCGVKMKYLTQKEAIDIDTKLFNEFKFSLDQLMELAGLSCSHAIFKTFPVGSLKHSRILICCGPGNNGGDGLVCARHLSLMGYEPVIYYPKMPAGTLFENLAKQCELMGLEFVPTVEKINEYSLIVDALFGFSFRPPIRQPFIKVMNDLIDTTVPIISIDIPSGWHVENGPEDERKIRPDLLISLTSPKLCSRFFRGKHHYLGGRFVPRALAEKYQLNLPEYPAHETVVRIN